MSYSVSTIFKAVDRMSGPMKRMSESAGRMAGRLSSNMDALTGGADRVLGGMSKIAVGAGAAVAAVSAIGGSIITTGASFERTLMASVAKFPGEIQRGTEAFEALRKEAERVGATTEFDAQQAAGALEVFASAGLSAEQAIASLGGAGDLATVASLGLDEAAKIAADSLGALGLRTDDAAQLGLNLARVNDVLAKTTSLANTSAVEMSESIAKAGNIAVNSGQSVETFGALVASMANANVKGAEAGTAVKNVLAALQAPSTRATKVLDALGVSVQDSGGNMRDIVDIIGDFERGMEGMGTAARTNAIAKVFGREGMGGFTALLNTGAEGLRGLRTQLDNAGGAAGKMAGTMRDTTTGDIDGFLSAIDGVKTALFGVVSGPFRDIINSMSDWIAKNTEFFAQGLSAAFASIGENADGIVIALRAIVGIAGGLIGVSLAIKAVAAAQAIWNAVLAINPVVAAVMAIGAAIGLVIAFWPEIKAFFVRIWDALVVLGGKVWTYLSELFAPLIPAVTAVFDFVKNAVTRYIEIWVGLFVWFGGLIWPLVEPIVDAFVSAFDWVSVKARMLFSYLRVGWQEISAVAGAVWSTVKAAAGTAFDWISEKAALVYGLVMEIWAPIGEFFSGLWDGIAGAFMAAFDIVVETISTIVGGITKAFDFLASIGGKTIGTRDGSSAPAPVVQAPRSQVAPSSETTTTNRAEVTIRAERGTQVTRTRGARGAGVSVPRTAGAT